MKYVYNFYARIYKLVEYIQDIIYYIYNISIISRVYSREITK